MALTIVATITAKPGYVEKVRQELLMLIAPTLQEAGCLQYDLHQDNENPSVFLFFENWSSREEWLNHMESPHLLAHRAATTEMVESIEIREMSQLSRE
ncbi:MAG: antibiotic biosynthesis monooxygenase [Bdellovibrionales bacterium]|nr:antibiotic biosynthesis monooxygenase [Bdellovibrionales bacterium]